MKKWPIKTLGEVCETTSGGTPSRGNKSYYNGTIPWVKSGELNKGIIYDTEEKITEEAIKNSSAKVFPKGTLLIALYGATIGKLAFLGVDAATNQAVCGIYKNESMNSKYIYNFLFHKKQDLVKQGIGGAQPNISQTILKKLELPVPPLETQNAIVSKIEELFSDIDKGVEDLKIAQQQLKTYRQSVLKWAFEGKLTNENLKEGELPNSWEIMKFGQVVNNYDGKRRPLSRDVRAKRQGEFRYYGATEIVDYIDDFLFDGKYLLIGEDGANLVSKSRPLAFIVDGKFWVNNHAHIVQTKELLNIDFLSYYFNSLNLAEYVTGTAQPKLNQANMNKIPIPIPKKEEQNKIVEELESRLSVADKMEESINESLKQAEALRQSILKKAFTGEFV